MPTDPTTLEETAVVVPAYNAGHHLGDVIPQIAKYVPVERIIVVDDGSSDDTGDVAAGAGARVVTHNPNRGKGAALRTGIDKAGEIGARFAVTIDADGQHDPAEIPSFIEQQRRTCADIVVGNRMAATEGMPWLRLMTNRATSSIVSMLAKTTIPDSQNGYRLISTELFSRIKLETTRYDTESEILIRAGRMGARITSVPTKTIYGGEESAINPFVDTGRFMRMVLRSFFW